MQAYALVALVLLVAMLLSWALGRRGRKKEKQALLTLADMAALGEVVPDTLHPIVDPDRCISSGACVAACPEKGVISLVHGRAVLLNPLACIGHSACMTACPVNAINVVFGTAKRGVELPMIDADFQTTRPGVYVIGELGGMGLIRNAVIQGREAAEHVARGTRRGVVGDCFDVVVVGAGPAGISATLRLMEAGLTVALIEREAFGGTIMHYPRAKVVMTGALELPMVGTVKRRTMSKEELVELWQEIHQKTKLPAHTGVLVEGIDAEPDGNWLLRTDRGTMRAANVMLALGRRGSPRKLEVPGEEQSKVHYRLLEPAEFRGKHVLVVGGGNSAVESAIGLADAGGCASVTISYRRNAFARCRAENRRRIDELIASGRVKALMPSEVESIGAQSVRLKADKQPVELRNDAVIVQVGGTAPSELLAKFGVEMVTKYGER